MPAGDKGTFTNFVFAKVRSQGFHMTRDFRGIYKMESSIIEIGFDDDFEPMKC